MDAAFALLYNEEMITSFSRLTVPIKRRPRAFVVSALIGGLAVCLLLLTSNTSLAAGNNEIQAPSAGFSWPLEPPHRVLRGFEAPQVRWGPGHRGVDLAAPQGSALHAPADGTVTFSGSVAGVKALTLHHPEGFDTTYEPIDDGLKVGTAVHRGDVIGKLGDFHTLDAGHCSESCLHWGYKVGDGQYRDPLTLVQGVLPVLLPIIPGG